MNRLYLSHNNLFALLLAAFALLWIASNGGSYSRTHRFQVPEVDVPQAKALIDAGALVIDVRGVEQFAYRHIAGAIVLPLEVLRAGIPASIVAAKDKPIVVYCNEGLAHGPEAAHILRQAGFTSVVNLRTGIEGWQSASFPVVKG
jgi:rhodanese-related sulfurtransferase